MMPSTATPTSVTRAPARLMPRKRHSRANSRKSQRPQAEAIRMPPSAAEGSQ